MSVPVAQVVRSGFVEGRHFGSAVVLAPDGTVEWSVGTVTAPIFPRSSNKLMQGLAMVRAGLPLHDGLLALACASHSGEEMHINGVHSILNATNMDVNDLQCPADWPLDPVERDSLIAQGIDKKKIFMNCSGKHAAMLFTSVINGWDTTKYLELSHPLQQACLAALEECTGEEVAHIGVDGCGAPLMSTSLIGLARSFGLFAGPHADADQKKIADAIRSNPEMLSGTRRPDAAMMRAVPGLVGKIGAEAVYGIGLSDGRSLAIKIDDGADRALQVVAASILKNIMGVKASILDEQMHITLFGGGHPVGEISSLIG